MRRILPATLVVLVVAALIAWWLATRGRSPEAGLARLPGVVDVQTAGPARPQATVIHLLDWHLVPREMLAPPGLIVTGRSRLYADHLDAVEAVQSEHEAILRHLAAKHGKLTVYVEGLTDAEVEVFRLKAGALNLTKPDIGRAAPLDGSLSGSRLCGEASREARTEHPEGEPKRVIQKNKD